ncbi:alkaline phosphatase family protein [Halobacterium litoreum]|uniref:alkaline phosphatase family protein n=1 Tax=Halobacterium litoreum TaxID=2039234 RepID=UPI0022B79480|nr:alkaline phosphatase family protein [Halobacterium litoreum]
MVLGIDGTTWTLLDRWLDDLPTLSGIVENGTSSELESSTPPVTSPAWRCYGTGKNPDDIGVYWWRQLDRETNEFVGADQLPLTDECYWERLSDAGYQVAVMGVPLNSPPQAVDGHFVSGGPFADPDNYTYPESLSDTLESEFDYQLHPKEYPSVENATDSEIVADFEAMIEQRFDVAEWLLEEHDPDFLNLTLFYINVMQHKAWDAPEVKGLWKVIDERIGELVDSDDNLIIHSDHGLHEVERVFYLNAWLEQQGYLSVTAPEDDRSVVDYVKSVTDALGISEQVGRVLPEFIRQRVGSGRRLLDSGEYESRIDFDESRAVALPQGPVYLLDDDPSFADALTNELLAVEDPKTGRRALEDIVPASDVYGDPVGENAPDLLVRWNDGFEVKNQHSEDEKQVWGSPHGVLADNAQQGVVIAEGPSFGSSDDVKTPYLTDIAPTVLHLFGEPIPEGFSGSVAMDLFAPGSEPANKEVSYTTATMSGRSNGHEDATQDVNDRLQDLGYLE